jgi:DNA-binding MarR family transcriptional regulator
MNKRLVAARKQTPARKKPQDSGSGGTPMIGDGAVHDLETSVPYLIARAGMMTGLAFSAELKQFGLTLTEWRVCAALRHVPHQRLSDLAKNTSSDGSTLSRTVDGMLQKGLLVRERSADDARALALALTPEGNALAERVIPLARLYERVALAGIEPQQVELLRTLLHRIYDNMETLSRGV